MSDDLARAAEAIRGARALLVSAGAGMGVDSGLPDFRGPEGFWRAYPPYRHLGLAFEDVADPRWFAEDPTLAWGFYGHRLNLYRRTTPHAGFAALRRWAERCARGAFVFTSNVDGAFHRAGFDASKIVECHGSIDHVQCTGCDAGIRRGDDVQVDVDPETFRAKEPLPRCDCGALLRPNILMFGDWGWDGARTSAQQRAMNGWLGSLEGERVVVVECGAGTAIPTVRRTSERVASSTGGTLIRVNVREPEGPRGAIGLAMGAKAALEAIDALVSR